MVCCDCYLQRVGEILDAAVAGGHHELPLDLLRLDLRGENGVN
jgi:hypothetical protein